MILSRLSGYIWLLALSLLKQTCQNVSSHAKGQQYELLLTAGLDEISDAAHHKRQAVYYWGMRPQGHAPSNAICDAEEMRPC